MTIALVVRVVRRGTALVGDDTGEAGYQAALQATWRVVQLPLMDFSEVVATGNNCW